MIRVRALAALLFAAGVAPAARASSTLLVPQQFPTIQAAVDASVDGDTIQISGGNYAENVVVDGRSGLLIRAKGKVVLDPSSGTGLTLNNCSNVQVEKLRAADAPHGFDLTGCTGCTLLKCRVDQPSQDGIHLEGGSGNHVESCVVSKAGTNGISLGDAGATVSSGNFVTKCNLEQPGSAGLFVNGSNNLIESCLVLKSAGDGLVVGGASPGTLNDFESCKVVKPAFGGAILPGSNNVVRGSKLIGCGGDAVDMSDCTGALLDSCKVVKAGGEGVTSDGDSVGATLTSDKVIAAASIGIDMVGSSPSVDDNKVSGAKNDGLRINGNDGVYSGNKVTGSLSDGFHLMSGSTGNTLSTNFAKGNKHFDLDDQSGAVNDIAQDNVFGTEAG